MSENKQSSSSADETQSENIPNNTEEALLDTDNPEYIVRYNLFYTGEYVGERFLPTGHANITLIERDGENDTIFLGGNNGVNLAGRDTTDSNGQPAERGKNSHVNPFDKNLDGIVGVDSDAWQGQGQAIYEQSVTPEQLKDVQDHITDLTGGLKTGLTNYNVAASVLPLKDQHSCYSFTQDVFEIAGGDGRLIDQFSEAELDKIKNRNGETKEILIETVHGDIPKIPERAYEKVKDTVKDAADAVSGRAESAIENVREKTGLGSSDENAPLGDEASLRYAINQAGSTPPFIPFRQAVQAFADDRELLRANDPEATLSITQAANHPEAEAMFVRLNDAGIEQFPSEALRADTPEDRVGNILVQAQEIDKTLEAERALEQENLNAHTAPSYEDEYDHSFGG